MYTANFTVGGILLHESRAVARFLLSDRAADRPTKKISAGDIVRKRSPSSSKRIFHLLLLRMKDLPKPFLEFLLSSGSADASLCLLSVCCEKHPLLGDFLLYIRRECIDQYRFRVSYADWNRYFAQCADADPSVDSWSEATRKKIRSTTFAMLADAGVIERKTGNLLPLYFPSALTEYLANPDREYARVRMEGLIP